MWAAMGAFALVAGPVIGGVLIKYLGWKSIFLINFPLGLMSIFVIHALAPNSHKSPNKINAGSQTFITIGLALLTFTLTEVGRYGWTNPVILSTLVLSLLSLVTYKYIDGKVVNPVIATDVKANKLIVSAVTIGFLCNLIFYGAVFIFSIFFQNKLHLLALETGIAFIPMMALTALINFSSKWFSSWYSIRTLSLLGSIVSLLGFVMVMFISPEWTASQLFVPMILLGSGTSFAMPLMTNLVLSQATHHSVGSASAFFNCARQMGGVSGVAIFGLIFSAGGLPDMTDGLRRVSLAAAVITIVWVVTGLRRLPANKLCELS